MTGAPHASAVGAGATPRHACWRARGPIAACVWLASALACADAAMPLDDLPRLRSAGGAVVVASAEDCDSNLQLLAVFQRTTVRDAIPLVGVVPLDARPDEAAMRGSLRAYDVSAPVLSVRPATRDSLRTLSGGVGMSVIVYDRFGRIVRVVHRPRDPSERREFEGAIVSLAATLRNDRPQRP